MSNGCDEVAARNREYYAAWDEMSTRVARTMRHLFSQATHGMRSTGDWVNPNQPPPEHVDGSEAADRAYYTWRWGSRPHSAAEALSGGGAETVVETYWIRAVYRTDGSLELHSAEGDTLIAEAEAGPDDRTGRITPVRAVVLKTQQDFGKKGFTKAIAEAFGHPVIELEVESTGVAETVELEGPTPYDDRRW